MEITSEFCMFDRLIEWELGLKSDTRLNLSDWAKKPFKYLPSELFRNCWMAV